VSACQNSLYFVLIASKEINHHHTGRNLGGRLPARRMTAIRCGNACDNAGSNGSARTRRIAFGPRRKTDARRGNINGDGSWNAPLQVLRYCCPAQTALCWAVPTGSADEFHRTENNNAAKQNKEVAAARPRAANTECLIMVAPSAAPNTIANIEPVRRCQRRLLPPARKESAARPVTVSVSTVVVRSGTPSFRTAAFLIPIAAAVRTMIE
jgi:hypothetical protein